MRLAAVAIAMLLLQGVYDRASVVDAMSHGFRPLVISDCVGDRAIGPHDANLFDMQQKYAAVMTLDEALWSIEKRQA